MRRAATTPGCGADPPRAPHGVVADFVGPVAALYRHFCLAQTQGAAALSLVRRALAERWVWPSRLPFEDHGLDAGAEREKFRSYVLRFGIP